MYAPELSQEGTSDFQKTPAPQRGFDWTVLNVVKQGLFWAIHAGCLLTLISGVSSTALLVCGLLYFVRMFAITGGYHRYFSHRSYKTTRFFQFVLAFLGASSVQKGPIWWASHHRHHHKHSDTEEDVHPPRVYGIWWAHTGWVLSTQFITTRLDLVKDLIQFPELRWLDKNHFIAPLTVIALLLGAGWGCQTFFPNSNVTMLQMFAWGFCVSTTLVYHGTFLVNSVAHVIGTQRFKTGDDSRNNFFVALLTLGEGWHNNHHRYPGSERQGFYWWEIDITHYVLKVLSLFGIVWDLRAPPARIYEEALRNKSTTALR
jgi:stearoyl-CoA desaturase (Delta-9 desaturase)